MSPVLLLRVLWFLPACAGLQLAHAASAPPTIVVLGDSLSAGYGMRVEEGWVALLQQKLAAQGYGYRVVNASVSGETTAGALARLPRALELHRPAIVVIEVGGNDGLRGLPLTEVRANLEALIAKSHAAGARVVLAGMRIPPNYGPVYTERFHALFGDVANRYRLPFVRFLLEDVALKSSLMQADGIHPNAEAQPVLLEAVWPAIEPLLAR